jgi:hypothetical protein
MKKPSMLSSPGNIWMKPSSVEYFFNRAECAGYGLKSVRRERKSVTTPEFSLRVSVHVQ